MQRALDDRRPNEPPFLQTLGEKTRTGAVPGQNLHLVAALAGKHERRPEYGSARSVCATSDAQHQQNATQRLGVERHFGAVQQADLHRAAPCASGRLTSFAMTSEGGGAEGASNANSFTGTKAGAPPSGGATTTGFSFTGSRRRSRHPSRERHIRLKARLAFSPCRRATAATEAPGARASPTILLR